MICVSIGRGRHRHMIAEQKHLVERGAQLVELRLDYIRGRVNIPRLLADRPCPVIITCRRSRDGGKYKGSEEERLVMLRTAIAEGADYVDLEEDIASNIPRYGKTQRIISMHDFRKTPENLEEIYARLASKSADIVKLATLANRPQDNWRMLQLVQQAKLPTVGICMGDMGIPSRILVGRFGGPFTYATFSEERALAPGQLSFDQMQQMYRYDQINAETDIYGVIADPITHTLSPLIHNAAFAHDGLNKVYVPFRIPREELDTFLDNAPAMGVKGLSVTIPHKEAVIKKLTKLDGAIRAIGAANTIVFDGKEVYGHNTDYRAAMDALESAMVGADGGEGPLHGKTALVLGAGGAAMALAAGLKRRQADVVVASRTLERAERLARTIGCKAVDWGTRGMFPVDVLVNCTPVGMHPDVDESPYERTRLRSSMVVFDTVYNPENTLLIKDARTNGCTVVTGVEMFVRQAALQFKLFTGRDAPIEVMRQTLKRATAAAKPVEPVEEEE